MPPLILPSDAEGVRAAIAVLRSGTLIGLPTETVYGLAGDAARPETVAAIYAAKGRPAFNPLIAHVASLEKAEAIAVFSPLARRLAQAFWPGPLTLVLPARTSEAGAACSVCELARSGLPSLAVRVPAHPVARAVLQGFGGPLAAPSANLSGHVSPTTAAHVAADLASAVSLILDGGACENGLESTIIMPNESDTAVIVLRKGSLIREALHAANIDVVLADTMAVENGAAPIAPGPISLRGCRDRRGRIGCVGGYPQRVCKTALSRAPRSICRRSA